jgi:D-3-phosphoglycerate dehydrogenase
MCARGSRMVDTEVRRGNWPKAEGISLNGQTIGVVGLGGIGRAVIKRAQGFDMHALAHDPFVVQNESPPGCTMTSLGVLLERSRFIVLACPLTAETHHLIDKAALGRMRTDCYVINVARGQVVSESALIEALQTGRIAGAALDVYEVEPLPEGSRLRSFGNVILGAHNGSNTREGVARASEVAATILLEELAK